MAFSAYHTGESFICVQLLQAMAFGRPTADVLADIGRLRANVRSRTNGVAEATDVSENSFERQLRELAGPPELSAHRRQVVALAQQPVRRRQLATTCPAPCRFLVVTVIEPFCPHRGTQTGTPTGHTNRGHATAATRLERRVRDLREQQRQMGG